MAEFKGKLPLYVVADRSTASASTARAGKPLGYVCAPVPGGGTYVMMFLSGETAAAWVQYETRKKRYILGALDTPPLVISLLESFAASGGTHVGFDQEPPPDSPPVAMFTVGEVIAAMRNARPLTGGE